MGWDQSDGYYVEIPDGEKIKSPNRCVVCNKGDTDTTISIHANPVGYHGLWVWQFRAGKKVAVPSHHSCGSKLKNTIFLRTFIILILAVIIVAFAIYYDWSRWTMIGVLLLALLFPIIWQLQHAPPFEFEFQDGIFEFRFSNQDYANEFANLNNTDIQQ